MVVHKKRIIEWTLLAKKDLKEVLAFYKKKSPQGYHLVRTAILETVNDCAKNPAIFVTDELKKPKDENIRTFTVYHTRVSYHESPTQITVLRLRHTSREPLKY